MGKAISERNLAMKQQARMAINDRTTAQDILTTTKVHEYSLKS